MSNSPSKPSFDGSSGTPPRSSGTPPGDGSGNRRTSAFRMTTESAQSKARQRLANPEVPSYANYYTAQQRGESTRVLLDLDSDDAGAGPLDKDDGPYQGRSGRSRVVSVKSARGGGVSTRRLPRPAREISLEPPPSAQRPREADPLGEHDGGTRSVRGNAVGRSGNRTKRVFKSAPLVEYSDDDDPGPQSHVDVDLGSKRSLPKGNPVRGMSPSPRKKARPARRERDWSMIRTPSPPPRPSPLPSPPPAPPLGSDAELPSVLEIMEDGAKDLEKGASHVSLIDDEALESQDESGAHPYSDDERMEVVSGNEYDLDDPFIDDDGISSDQSDTFVVSRGRRSRGRTRTLGSAFTPQPKGPHRSSARSPQSDGESPAGGLCRLIKGRRPDNVPDASPARDASKGRPKPRPIQKQSKVVIDVDQDVPSKRINADGSSTSTPKKTDKGKGRAPLEAGSKAAGVDAEGGGDVNLSDMSEWERTQFELAVQASKASPQVVSPGESSGLSSHLSTPQARGLFSSSSPALTMPQATAMFTSATASSVTTPTPPSTQASRRAPLGQPMSMQELVRLARANAQGTSSTTPTTTVQQALPRLPPGEKITLIMLCTEADIPAICQVSHPAFQDPILADQYADLVNLLEGILLAWGRTPGRGFVSFSAWADQCPNMNAMLALDAVNFIESGLFKNPSRSSPVKAGLYQPSGTSDRFNFYCAGDDPAPLIAVTCGMMDDSQLLKVGDGGLRQKWVKVILHNQEMQRYTGFIRMVSGYPTLHAQYNKHALQFSTRPLRQSPENPNMKGKDQWRKNQSKGLRVPESKMFSSPGGPAPSPDKLSADTFSLPAEGRVPVYDARRVPSFNFQTDLSRLSEVLPAWTEEVPYGSFVVVGHTISVYKSMGGNWTLGCNIQWVIIVGTPDMD